MEESMESFTFTKDQIIKAFKDWETFNRLYPDQCSDSKNSSVDTVAAQCSDTLIKYLNNSETI